MFNFFRASFMIWQLSSKVKKITKGNNTFDSILNQPGQQNWAINFLRIASHEIPSISEWVRNQYQWPIPCHVLASGFLERKRDTDLPGAGTIHFHQAVQALGYICLWDCPENLWNFSKLERDATSPKVPIIALSSGVDAASRDQDEPLTSSSSGKTYYHEKNQWQSWRCGSRVTSITEKLGSVPSTHIVAQKHHCHSISMGIQHFLLDSLGS